MDRGLRHADRAFAWPKADTIHAVTRRDVLLGLTAATVAACGHGTGAPVASGTRPASNADATRELAAIEASLGGRVGVSPSTPDRAARWRSARRALRRVLDVQVGRRRRRAGAC
jgi:hypothetical protein